MDKPTFYHQTPAIRRRKRGAPVVQPPTKLAFKVDGNWETFSSVAELVAFRAARGWPR